MRGSWRTSVGDSAAVFVFTTWIRTDPVICGIRMALLPVKTVSTSFMADDGGAFVIVPLPKAWSVAIIVTPVRLLRGKR